MIKKIKNTLQSIKAQYFTRTPRGRLIACKDRFYDLVPRGAEITRLATGFQFTEGPVWLPESRIWLFSDIPANIIYCIDNTGKLGKFREPSFHSNGLVLDNEGRLIACEHGSRRLTRTENDGSITMLADEYNGHKLNSPNDVVVKSDGSIYFTDPPYGITPEQQEQPIRAVFRISPDGSNMTVVADDFVCPNGLAFSPDEKKLYIDDSDPSTRQLRVLDVKDDGSLHNGKLFKDMNIDIPGSPDGMKLDRDGNIYCTGPGGIWVMDGTGERIGTIETPETSANCAWGEDGKTLFITAQTSVYKIRTTIPGIPAKL